MTEEEEFEFRLRYEQEQAPQQAPEAPQQPEIAQPAETYSGWVKGLRDPVDALSQMLYESIPEDVKKSGDALNNWIAEKTGLLEPIPEDGFGEQLRQQEETYQAGRQAEGDEGIDWDRIGGNILSTAVPGVGAARAVAPVSTAGKIATGVGTGAAYGTLTPTQEEDFWSAKAEQAGIGAVLGGAIPGVGAVGGKAVGYIDELTKPMYQGGVSRDVKKFITEKAGPEREKIIAALQQAKETVPGSRPTAGQAIAQATSPGDEFGGQFAKLESELAREPIVGTKLKDIYGEQAARREDIINAIAGTDDALAAAEKAREASSRQDYGAAYKQKPKITEKVTQAVEPKPTGLVSPSGQPIMGKATTKKVTKIESELRNLLSEPYIKKAIPTANNLAKTDNITLKSNPTKYLHYVKIGLDKQLQKTGEDALTNTEKRAVQKVKTKMGDWMRKKNNLYEVARAEYAKQSEPINRMKVGQELKKALIGPAEQERATSFLGAMREAPRTLKRATGFKRYEELGDVLTPEQTGAVKSVSEDLINQAKAKAAAAGTKSIMSDLPGEVTLSLPHILSRPVVVTNHLLSMLGKDKTTEYKEMLVDILKDPGSLEKALQLPAENAKAKMAKDIAKEISIMTSVKTQQLGE
jgi:hypothetical protein